MRRIRHHRSSTNGSGSAARDGSLATTVGARASDINGEVAPVAAREVHRGAAKYCSDIAADPTCKLVLSRTSKGGRTFALSKAQVRLARKEMASRATSVTELCRVLGIGRVTLYRYVDADGGLREHGRRIWASDGFVEAIGQGTREAERESLERVTSVG